MDLSFILYLYVLTVIFGLICNISLYNKFDESEGEKKIEFCVILITRIFLGPISVYINIRNLCVYTYRKVRNYIYMKRLEKDLQKEIENALIEALKNSNIEVVD